MRIAITGASGFVGGAIATALARANVGHEIVGFGRIPNGWSFTPRYDDDLPEPGAPHRTSYRVWDITSGPLPSDVAGAPFDAVVHAAALADDWAPLGRAMAVNRIGTRTVAESFPEARLVHISTSSVYDAFVPTVRARESTPLPSRWLSAYSESKAAAELELAGRECVILRPHAVYGEGDTTLLPRLAASVRAGRLVLPAGGNVLHTLTHIDNLVDAVRLALAPGAPSGIFNVGDDTAVLLSAVLRELLTRRGQQKVRVAGIPYRTAFGLATVSEATARATRRRPRLTRYAVSQLGMERTLDLAAAREQLGYEPRPTTLIGAENW